MPRDKRIRSKTGIYHIMLRGIDKRSIFEDNHDREVFIHYVWKAKCKSDSLIFGYCLMDNHVHMLLKEGNEPIGDTVKRLTVGYVQWYNRKYGRVGHLLQNRYNSECVETDSYLLTVLRYIHQNPLKAGLVKDISEYCWSSYNHYINGNASIIDRAFIMELFSGINEFKVFMTEDKMEKCIDDDKKTYFGDEDLRIEIEKIVSIHKITGMERRQRNDVISLIKKETKASSRQISRVIGIGRGIIERVK